MTPADLVTWRTRYGFSQSQAAAVLHVNARTLQGWEQPGRVKSLPDFLANYCRLVGDEIDRQQAATVSS